MILKKLWIIGKPDNLKKLWIIGKHNNRFTNNLKTVAD